MGLGTGNAAARVFDWDVVIIGGLLSCGFCS